MKKVLAFFMTAVMVCSMGVTTAFGATAKASADKVAVNGQQVKMQAYNINGYNYFKLRDLTQVHDFWIFWDAETKTIGVDSDNPVGYGGPGDEEEKVIPIDEFAKNNYNQKEL